MPSMLNSRRASQSLSFIIVGGSISGLACAYTLSRAGHQVTVLEKGDGKNECGVRSPPNMTRILQDWGLQGTIEEVGVKASATVFRAAATSEKVGILQYHPQIMEALRADLWYLPYGFLWSELYKLAVKAGADVRFNAKVAGVDPEEVVVTTDRGEQFRGDLIIGADGSDSVIRRVVVEDELSGTPDPLVTFSTFIPTELMKKDTELQYLVNGEPDWNIWLADGCCLHGHLTRSREYYTMVAVVPADPKGFQPNWDERYSPEDLNLDLSKFHPSLRRLWNLARTVIPTKYVVHEPFSNIVHEDSKVLLVGDAAQTTPPQFHHSYSMGIEAAATLGNLFSRLRNRDQADTLVTAYEEIRQPRITHTFRSEDGRYRFITFPDGPEQQVRDAGLQVALQNSQLDWDDADEEYLRAVWDDYIAMFNYDASEAVDDWWTMWGSLM
ncbi:FAD/NAD P-binding domain-containing protein [Gloeophyllum trabeum ATCC 11539]|uniref:FAD/NAD P-binding domain-containing protein n=1 Tax=Gloeophyllum trabeum (strain ATCC 11539 / FP-39264 / Madison 617) TaxID=670483 RepID=S7Q9M7_GLOTA|nr:FAD/NAD P-binding domain-containing protein [Gloeophyllum trabeum ATCC 11539]EPQ56222.1 FAD/NAD P-binding domain-containing protein [Gloeophyllum trabeum ATCC 11539]